MIEDNKATTDNTASELVSDYLTEYGRSILRDHFPSPVDGLKSVHRRFLYSMRNVTSSVKSSAAIAQTKTYHDHGDPSIYESIIRLAVSFHHRPPIVHVNGNAGTYADPTMAAARYTSIEMRQIGHDLFYADIDMQALPKVPTSDMMGTEPKYLVPALPTALLYASNTIGYGFGSLTPCQNFNDVCDLVSAYADHYPQRKIKPFPYHKHIKKFLPDFPIVNTITNEEDLRKAYKEGDFNHRISLEGEVDLYHDRIVVRTLPYGVPVNTVSRIQDKLRHRNSWEEQCIASVDDYSRDPNEANITIRIKKNTDVFTLWDGIKKYISIYGSYVPNRNYVLEDGYIENIPPYRILELWFTERCALIEASKRKTLGKLYRDLHITEAYLAIYDDADRVIEIIKTSETTEDSRKNLMAVFTHLSVFQAKYLLSVPISTLTKTSKKNLLTQYETQKKKIQDHIETFSRIPQEVSEKAQALKKKYNTPRTSRLPSYVGHVYLPELDGTIQFETHKDIHALLERFPRNTFDVYTYDADQKPVYFDTANNKIYPATSKHYRHKVFVDYRTKDIYTIHLDPTENTACSVKGLIPNTGDGIYFYVPKKVTGIKRNGEVKNLDVTKDISLRKNAYRRGSITPFIHFHPVMEDPYYLICLNDEEPNLLLLMRIDPSKSNIMLPPKGTIKLIPHASGIDWYVNYTPKFFKRLSARLFYIANAQALLGDKTNVRIDLNQRKWRRSTHLQIFQ